MRRLKTRLLPPATRLSAATRASAVARPHLQARPVLRTTPRLPAPRRTRRARPTHHRTRVRVRFLLVHLPSRFQAFLRLCLSSIRPAKPKQRPLAPTMHSPGLGTHHLLVRAETQTCTHRTGILADPHLSPTLVSTMAARLVGRSPV